MVVHFHICDRDNIEVLDFAFDLKTGGVEIELEVIQDGALAGEFALAGNLCAIQGEFYCGRCAPL